MRSRRRLRHFRCTWLKQQGTDDALVQPYSDRASRRSPEISSRLALAAVREDDERAIGRFPV
ncbi:MAG TPA: hypothetical protein VFL91_21715 [Thermomicrobiales bacterium]|nr:hypothetical protein [Thermomicrobiales bacterium]